ncbi:MAG: ribosomal protein methyltransferase [Solirubrobacteraceae bacterium]|jgi:ribosomal protein L11 methyltransferase|nr:ribosomal protein methyltransferase [Solirubrobacteraceae bacterium]
MAVRVRRPDAELALVELLNLAPAGVEEVDDDGGEWVEYALYGAPGELPDLPDLRAAAGDALVEVSTSEVADDWAERWKHFHGPVEVGGRVWVRPPWSDGPPRPGLLDLVIDPGQAFGTGAHPTTKLCLELTCELERRGAFVDLGCGSGVLAIAAAKLGWSPVLAVDHDPASVEATAENARVNGVEIEVSRVDLRREDVPAAPTAVANLVRPMLLELAPRVPAGVETLIVGGLLPGEADEVAAAFAAHGLRERDRRAADGWAALLLGR